VNAFQNILSKAKQAMGRFCFLNLATAKEKTRVSQKCLTAALIGLTGGNEMESGMENLPSHQRGDTMKR
jgi:hypothetical protein